MQDKTQALIVDDNENNRMLEKDLLELAGFLVFEAEDAATGMALAGREKFDVIIMDVRLPDMRGTEAAMLLRKRPETRDIPIVFVTASVMAEGMEKVRAIPNSGFIGKPINTRSFAEEVLQFMQAAG